jgi:hypothetical protein
LVADVGYDYVMCELTDACHWSYTESDVPVGFRQVLYRRETTYDGQLRYVHPDYYRWESAPERRWK